MQRYLFDTHALLWYAAGDSQLPGRLVRLLDDPDTRAFSSTVSL